MDKQAFFWRIMAGERIASATATALIRRPAD
jgi:hypothetical protein